MRRIAGRILALLTLAVPVLAASPAPPPSVIVAPVEVKDVAPVQTFPGQVQAIQSVVGRDLAYSLLMQQTDRSPEGRPLVFRPLADDVPTNSVMASLPAGVARSALVKETLAALRARVHGVPAASGP